MNINTAAGGSSTAQAQPLTEEELADCGLLSELDGGTQADVPPPMPLERIIEIADSTRTAEPAANGYILPVSFARAIEAARDKQWQQRIRAQVPAGEPPMPPKHHPRGAAYVYTEQAVAEFAAAWKQREADLLERIRALSARPADTPPAPDEAEVQRVLGYLRESEAEVRAGKEQIVWADTMARAADLIRNLAAQPDNHREQGNV